MTAVTQTRKKIPISFYPLLALTLFAVALSIYRLVVGLGPTTNLTDHYPWGMWITIDYFLIPVAGAAFTISFITHFYGRDHYTTALRPSILAGFLGYAIVGILLFLDIGRWHQFYNILNPQYINLHSFLEEVSLSVTFYTIILVIEIAPTFLEKWGYERPIRFINRFIIIIAGAGIILSALHQSSLGSMFLIMRHKLHPLWWTPALPLIFFLQAIYTGLAATAVAVTLIWKRKGYPIDREFFRRIGQAMSIALGLYLAVKVGDWMGAGKVDLLFQPDAFGILVWLELIIGIFIPLIILLSKLGGHSAGPFWAGVFVLIGTFINRLIISWIGLAEPSPIVYSPHWIEIMITIGLLSGGFLAYGIVVRYFRLFKDDPIYNE
ncbi:MAG: polysulfide reductase NrfD [Chloroflexi bacterium]|nr:polysulfide reductase NrfD [Chloroflexota bacterium]